MPTYIFIPIIILVLSFLSRAARNRFVKPKVASDGVQTPGGFDRFLLNLITGLTVFAGLMAILGAIMRETEMSIVFAVLTVIFLAILMWLRYEYNMTYQEHDDFFIYTHKNKEYKVYYDNIDNWAQGHNEIKISDETQSDEELIRVNIAMIKPNILLRKIADMTFEGKYEYPGPIDSPDPKRQYEIVNFLIHNNYGHLVEDYAEQLNIK